MGKNENKTKPSKASALKFLKSLPDKKRKEEALKLLSLMNEWTGSKPVLWGTSIVGYGRYHYKTGSGREGDFFITGFSPRKQNMTLYIMPGFKDFKKELSLLGKHKTSVSCLYFKSLKDLDTLVLKRMVKASIKKMKRLYKESEI